MTRIGRTERKGFCPPASVAAAVFTVGMMATMTAQQQDPSLVAVAGRAMAADTGVPLRRVRIAVSAARRVEPVFTDDQGRFVLTLAARAPATITATKAGYATTLVRLPEPEAGGLTIPMQRGAVVSGRVVDANGVPAVATLVVARRTDGGAASDPSAFFTANTDDDGQYRIGGLPAGRFVVGARAPASSIVVGSAPVVIDIVAPYNGTRTAELRVAVPRVEADAPSPIVLRPGDDVRGVDVIVPAPSSSAEIRRFALEGLRDIAIERGRQPPSDPPCFGTGALRGRVATSTGEPLAGASVRVERRPLLSIATEVSGRDGTYTFECMQPGEYIVRVERRGYLHPAGPATIALAEKASVIVPDVVLQKGGTASGMVIDEHGEPMAGVRVRALQVRYSNGRNTAVASGFESRTDDAGRFRIFGMPGGAFVLEAVPDASLPGAGRALGYTPMFYPGTSSIGAAMPLQAAPGLDFTGLTIVFRPTIAATVAGTASDASGEPLTGSVMLAPSARAGALAMDPIVRPTGPDGAFEIPGVPPGDYIVRAVKPAAPGSPAEFGSEYVTVTDRDPPPLDVRTTPGATLEGRLTIEGGRPADITSNEFVLMAHPSDPDRSPVAVRRTGLVIRSTGEFYALGLYGPMRIVLASAPPEWYLKSVAVHGTDVTDTGFELPAAATVDGADVVVSTRGASITGRTVDDRDRPVPASVVVMPVDRTYWTPYSRYLKTTRTKPDGSFEIEGLPPGDYWITAVDALDTDGEEWRSPSVLDALAARAERLALGESEGRTIVVPLGR